MLRWRIYYGDGPTFSSEDGPPESAPKLNAQVVARPDATVGRELLSGRDYYWWEDRGEWDGGDLFGLFDYLSRPGPKVVLFGRSLSNEQFRAIRQRAIEDPELPPKSARYAHER